VSLTKLTIVALAAAGYLSLGARADSPLPQRRSFVGCPVIRDTQAVPCWLASDGRQLYYLGIQVDISAPFHPPELLHQVLVEGVIADEPNVCGGIVLKPVTITVLPEIDRACNTILPAQGYAIADAPRGPGPSNRGKYSATGATPMPARPAPPPPEPPFAAKTFSVPFAFDDLYMDIHAFPAVLAAAHYANAIPGAHVQVVGYRAAVQLNDGRVLVENPEIARRRAEKVGEALEQLDIARDLTTVRWKTAAEDAAESPGSRRVEITVEP
jgi:outer membrane protein OmpA-like peptidoglycan-associated protein